MQVRAYLLYQYHRFMAAMLWKLTLKVEQMMAWAYETSGYHECARDENYWKVYDEPFKGWHIDD